MVVIIEWNSLNLVTVANMRYRLHMQCIVYLHIY